METIKLDLIPGKKMPSLHASQYDDGREHGIDLFENGVVYKLDGTETLTINERKGDDCICSLDIENTFADSNHIVFASTEQMCAVWGNNICELVIAKGEKTIGTLNFILEIEQSPTENGIESESEISNLERQIEAITEEVIGDNYYTKTQTDNAIATAVEGKADKTDTYTKTQVDTALNGKADKDTTYTKTQVDSEISRLDGRIDTKANASDVYTKSQTDNLLNGKADVSDLPDMTQYYDKSEVDTALNAKADKETTYTKSEVDGIVYNILPDDTASGSVANFETGLALPIKSLEIDVNAKQDLHGYDYPWTAGGGKNKCSMPNTTFEQFAEVEIDEIPAGSYVYSAVITSTDTDSDKCAIIILDENKNTLISRSLDRSVGNVRVSTSFSVSAPIKFLRLYAASGFPSGAGDTASFVDNMICLQSASNPTVFEPYENICPIEGLSEISLTKCGVNLWDEETENGYLSSSDGSFISHGNSICSKNYRLINPSAQVYVATSTDKTLFICWYDEDKAFISRAVCGNTSVTSPFNARYFKLSCYNYGSTYNNDTSVNYSSSDTTYHAYNGNTEVIELGGTYYGGHFTQDKAGHRQFEVTWCDLTDLGSLNWGTSNEGRCVCNPSGMAIVPLSSIVGDILSDYYKPDTHNNVWNRLMDNTIAVTNNPNAKMVLYDSNLGTKTSEQVKAYLSGRSVIYGLATPIIIDLPDGEPIITLNGTNNIYADSGDTEVVFKCSVNDYVSAHSGGNLLGMGGVYLGGAKSGGSEEEPTEESEEPTEEPKEVTKTLGDEPISKK